VSLDLVLRVGTKLILPFILLFALYVQFHGEYGPGGGFQAGVITAGMVILVGITFGLSAAQRIAPQRLVERMIPVGVLIFGIFLVEVGVLVTVSGTMTALFYAFVERGR
jgi:multicomponent Na+:H+ antiporter subunit B